MREIAKFRNFALHMIIQSLNGNIIDLYSKNSKIMNLIFCKLNHAKKMSLCFSSSKNIYFIPCKLKRVKNHEFHFFFCNIKKPQKAWLYFLFSGKLKRGSAFLVQPCTCSSPTEFWWFWFFTLSCSQGSLRFSMFRKYLIFQTFACFWFSIASNFGCNYECKNTTNENWVWLEYKRR